MPLFSQIHDGLQRETGIRLSGTPLHQLKKQLGVARCEKLVESLRTAAGDRVKGQSMVSIMDPGGLPTPKQKALLKAFVELL